MLALLLLSGFASGAASASTHGSSGDPSPQKAPPVPSSSTPAPDPTPQAAAKSQPSSSTSRPTESAPPPVVPRGVPTVGTPENPGVVHTTTPPRPSSGSGHVATVPRRVGARAPAPHRPAMVSHAPPRPRHARPAHATKPQHISPSFPLASLTSDLFRLPRAALHAGETDHRDGVLLLLSALAMGVVAVSSFTLLRRLKRLEGEAG